MPNTRVCLMMALGTPRSSSISSTCALLLKYGSLESREGFATEKWTNLPTLAPTAASNRIPVFSTARSKVFCPRAYRIQ